MPSILDCSSITLTRIGLAEHHSMTPFTVEGAVSTPGGKVERSSLKAFKTNCCASELFGSLSCSTLFKKNVVPGIAVALCTVTLPSPLALPAHHTLGPVTGSPESLNAFSVGVPDPTM